MTLRTCPSMGGLSPFRGPGGAPRAATIVPRKGRRVPGLASARRTGRAIAAWLGWSLFGRGHSGYRPSHSAQTAVFGTPPQPAVRR
jgi:hypothetical protein